MKALKYFLIPLLSMFGIYACSTTKHIPPDPNIGNIEIEIKVISGKDSIVRTANGDSIGKIDKQGYIYDFGGNKIGKRKPTDQELIQQTAF
jgi:hypothetical protein